nr:hypothetical protein [Geotalea toluenoxydans]
MLSTISAPRKFPPWGRLWSRYLRPSAGAPRAIPPGVARLAAAGMEAFALVSGKPPLLTRYTVDYLAKNHIYDTSRAARELGFVAKIGYREGIAQSVRQYLQHRQA